MALANENFQKLQAGYLFPEIAARVKKYTEANPEKAIIKMGIGDVTEPLPPSVVKAMHDAVDEMADRNTFRGYGPEKGYDFLRDAIVKNEYQNRGCNISSDEVFVSDGSKCDCANILDIFGDNIKVAITDPVYPVYVDTNVMVGNTGSAGTDGRFEGIEYLPLTQENNFSAPFPSQPVDLIYLCFPNNPTGVTADKETLTAWVNYALENNAIILFDAAYEAFITEPEIPHTIYEIPGAEKCAIEFRSFSKNAGFTGTRCAWIVVPNELNGKDKAGNNVPLNPLWNRRHSTKFNGVPYIIQKGAEAVYSPEGQKETKELVSFYLENARLLKEGLEKQGFECFGGVNAPYIWIKTPNEISSWDFFDLLLNETQIVGTPGSGFGSCGEGYFRLSAFNSRENILAALDRIEKLVVPGAVSSS